MKKVLVLLLSFVFVFSVFAACKGSEEKPKTTTDTNPTTETDQPGSESETSNKDDFDELPDLDFEGTSIKIAIRDKWTEFFIGEDSGDVIWSAVYKSNGVVDGRLNIKHEFIKTDKTSHGHVDKMMTLIAGNDCPYDLILVDQFYGCAKVLDDSFANFRDPDYNRYLDFDKPYWYSDYMDKTMVNSDYMYFLGGDCSPSMLAWAACSYFNWNMYEDNFGDPHNMFTIVDNGEWTLDKLSQFTKDIYQDLDDSKTSNENDRLGFAVCAGQSASYACLCAGMKFSERDEDGMYQFCIKSDKNEAIFQKVYSLYNETPGVYVFQYIEGKDQANEMFRDGKALFMNEYFRHSWNPETRNMTDKYAIIPRPKFDEDQDYVTFMQDPLMLYVAPKTLELSKADAASAYLEAICIENHRIVFPAMYEQALKVKYQSDVVDPKIASRMIDLIYNSLTADFAQIYTHSLNNIADRPAGIIADKQNTFISTMDAVLTGAQERLEEMELKFRA